MPRLDPRALSELIKSFARKRYGASREIFGIGLSPHYAGITKLICDNIGPPPEQIFEMNNLPPDQSQKFLSINEDAGNLVKFDDGIDSRKTANLDDVMETEIVVSPGLAGGDTPGRLHSTLTGFQRLFPSKKCAIYSPKREGLKRPERYAMGLRYYANQESIDIEESANFFNKVIKPKITDESGNLIPPKNCQKFVLANFSIGCREAESHFRFFQEWLRSIGLPEDVVAKYLDRMALLHIASPRNWNNFTKQPYTLGVISLTDAGSKKPSPFLLDFYLREEFHQREVSKILRPILDGTEMNREILAIMGPGVATCGGVHKESGQFIPNPLGHNLANYIDGIENNSELSRLVTSFDVFLNSKISSQEFADYRSDLLCDAKPHKEIEKPSEEGMEALFETWHDYQELEIKAERNSPFAARFPKKERIVSKSDSLCEGFANSKAKTDKFPIR
jgi:hypothetical protein